MVKHDFVLKNWSISIKDGNLCIESWMDESYLLSLHKNGMPKNIDHIDIKLESTAKSSYGKSSYGGSWSKSISSTLHKQIVFEIPYDSKIKIQKQSFKEIIIWSFEFNNNRYSMQLINAKNQSFKQIDEIFISFSNKIEYPKIEYPKIGIFDDAKRELFRRRGLSDSEISEIENQIYEQFYLDCCE